MAVFAKYELRTIDVEAARRFYEPLIGPQEIVPLPEAARARGAPAHWLGSIGVAVDDLDAAAKRLGATRLGGDVFRDPGGVIVGLCAPREPRPGVVWRVLNSDAPHVYVDAFGWEIRDRQLAPEPGAPTFATIAPLAGRPGVHPHWLFVFSVEKFDPSASGELVSLEHGIAVCHDPQGALFALREVEA